MRRHARRPLKAMAGSTRGDFPGESPIIEIASFPKPADRLADLFFRITKPEEPGAHFPFAPVATGEKGERGNPRRAGGFR